jgi:ferredoxin-thioredoxin reductase catalytic subunit/rubredoxin
MSAMSKGGYSPEVMELFERLKKEAEDAGYRLNPDLSMTLPLVESLLKNESRYGYQACPCRLAFGERDRDLDVICPCDYRDPDLSEFGACYCGLYVGPEVAEGRAQVRPIPERRPEEYALQGFIPASKKDASGPAMKTAIPVWRCRVCGYLCAREQPPGICPICKAKKDRFERFVFSA